ncbi:MAG: F0F1 ATP synthase subunit delta [Gammaproteobacteria bacterium]
MAGHDSTVARPYAQAAFELAQAAGELQDWSDFLQVAARMVLEPEVGRLLDTPAADLGRLATTMAELAREQLGGRLLAGERAEGVNFLRLLVENRRLAALPDIAARFEVLKAEAENSLDVTLTSATPVGDEQRGRIEQTLNQRFNRRIRLAVQVDPGLIGGARLQVGDRIIDGSVRTGLDKLATALRV